MNHDDPSTTFHGYDVAGLEGVGNVVLGAAFFLGGGVGTAEAGGNFLVRGVSRKIEFLEKLSENFAAKLSSVAETGELVAPRTISSVSGHGVNAAITRGFKASDILKIVKEGTPVLRQGRYGPQWRYMLNGNTVIINATKNRLITVFSNFAGTANKLGAGKINPFL